MKVGYADIVPFGTRKYEILGRFDKDGKLYEALKAYQDRNQLHNDAEAALYEMAYNSLANADKVVVRHIVPSQTASQGIRMPSDSMVYLHGGIELIRESDLKDCKEE